MHKPFTEQLPLSRLEAPSQPISLKRFDPSGLFGQNVQFSRLVTHGVVLSLILGMVSLGGFKELASRQLEAPQYVPPAVTTEVERGQTNERPLTLPRSFNKRTSLLFPIPIPNTIIPEPEAAPIVVSSDEIQNYAVQPGDTVFGIALKFDLAPETILWANPILEDNPDLLRLGQELTILPVDGIYHQVGGGDTIAAIASTFKVDPETVIDFRLNHLDPENPVIYPGQWLVVPNGIKPYVPKVVSAAAVNAPDGVLSGSGNIQWPASGSVTQEFWSGHRALDIGAWKGAPIYAVDDGYVVAAQWDDTGYGRMVVIDHGNGLKSLYAHLNVFFVSVGDEVTKGQQIGSMGTTGRATGPHLHFELLVNGVKRNPWGFLP